MKNLSSKNLPWKNSQLLQGISEMHLRNLESHLMDAQFSKGDFLIREGTFGDAIFFIEKGKVVIQKDNIKLAKKKAGDYVGAMALMENTTRSADVIALEPTEVKVLTINQLKAIESDELFYKMLNNHLIEQQALLRKMNETTIKETKMKLQEAAAQVKKTRFYLLLIVVLFIISFGLLLYLLSERF